MIDVKGKKILFIGIGFYDYEKTIKDYLEGLGAKVYYFSSFFNFKKQRLYRRLGLIEKAIRISSSAIMSEIVKAPEDINQIIIIKAEDFGQEHIDALQQKYPGIKKTLYLWDSLERLHNKDLLLANFDRILTFDRKDAEKYSLFFRPLFARKFRRVAESDIMYDISFVGYMHSTRYEILHQLKKILDKENISYKFILSTGKFNKWFLLNVSHKVANDDKDMLLASQLPYVEYIEILKKSNVILDISHPRQSGLTMRTIETLCLGKKLMTTNEDIKNYPFNQNQYRILTAKFDIDFEFLRNKSFEESDMSDYSLEKFISDLLTC